MLSASRVVGLADRFAAESHAHLPPNLPTDQRWFSRVRRGSEYDVWLIAWPAGTSTGLHDHGENVIGAVRIVSGQLQDNRWSESGFRQTLWSPDFAHFLPRRIIHDVVAKSPSVSVHVYSPHLTLMNFYEADEVGIVRTRTEEIQ